MKTLILISVLSGFNLTCKKDFDFVSATSQKWHGGRPESGYGTYFEIKLIPKKNSDIIKFDKLWIADKYFEITPVQSGRKDMPGIFDAGNEISVTANDKKVPQSKGQQINESDQNEINKKNPLPPFNYKGAALLSYTVKGNRKYFEIKEFKLIEEVYYPNKQ